MEKLVVHFIIMKETKYNKEVLKTLIFDKKLSYESIGRTYGVTGNAIKKIAKNLGLQLKPRRRINPCEDFVKSSCKRSNVDKISDAEFIQIINSNVGWKEITDSLGYSNSVGSGVKHAIKERCTKLGISPKIKKISPVLLKTKGQLKSERKSYQSYRSAIRKLAEKIYKESNRDLKCSVCGYDKHVEIAHIKAVSDFNEETTIAEINSLDNLIALCPNHHWEFDSKLIDLEIILNPPNSLVNKQPLEDKTKPEW